MRVPSFGVGLAEVRRAEIRCLLRDLSGASARVLSALALPSNGDRVAAAVLDVSELAAKVFRPPGWGDSLYTGDERTRGEPR